MLRNESQMTASLLRISIPWVARCRKFLIKSTPPARQSGCNVCTTFHKIATSANCDEPMLSTNTRPRGPALASAHLPQDRGYLGRSYPGERSWLESLSQATQLAERQSLRSVLAPSISECNATIVKQKTNDIEWPLQDEFVAVARFAHRKKI